MLADSISLTGAWAALAAAAVFIAFVGTRLTTLADCLADRTGLGEAIFGAVFLGASTSLAGIATSLTAAHFGHADLAFSNAIGGIAVQTAFLAVADICYRPANLEHAAASQTNLLQGAFLILLLALTLMFISGPPIAWGHVHLGSPLILLAYLLGIILFRRSKLEGFWRAMHTPETVYDRPQPPADSLQGISLSGLWLRFGVYAALLSIAGYLVAQSAAIISDRTGLSQTIVGGLFTAIVTSLPELVTSIAAVRRRALTLAVGNIIGGNSFEILILPLADIVYRPQPIYQALGMRHIYVIAAAIIITAVMLLGLLRREKHGILNIGFESALVLLIYFGTFCGLFFF